MTEREPIAWWEALVLWVAAGLIIGVPIGATLGSIRGGAVYGSAAGLIGGIFAIVISFLQELHDRPSSQ